MQNQSLPKIAVPKSVKVDVEAGKSYYWCACGLSQSQPFCDGSHVGTEFSPLLYQATESKTVGFCGCKQSKNSPVCDGAHKTILI